MANLKWVALPEGRPWWPGVVVDLANLDMVKHAEAFKFWELMRSKRGNDPLQKDVLVSLCCIARAEGDEGHRFAVVSKSSLRPFQAYASMFSEGVVSSGRTAGQLCDSDSRRHLKATLASIGELIRRSILQSDNPVVTIVPRAGGLTRSARSILEENKELGKLKKELQNVRRKMTTRPTPRASSTSPPPAPSPESSTVQQADQSTSVAAAAAIALSNALAASQGSASFAEYYPELNSQTVRIWDFCHCFHTELNLSSPMLRIPFANITSFEACMAEPDCSLFAQVACQLVSYLSVNAVTETEERWDFASGLSARLGSRCTPLTWECLWDTLIARGVLPHPNDPSNKRDILDSLVQACCELSRTKTVFTWRLTEYASELSNPLDFQSTPAQSNPIEIRSYGDLASTRFSEIHSCTDFYQVERLIDSIRSEHERLDLDNGLVVSRTLELNNAMAWEEKLFTKVLSTIKMLSLGRQTRSIGFGKDHLGRSLFSFKGDEDEEEARVWAREDDTDRWFLYRGDFSLAKLIELVTDRECRQVLVAILFSSRKRFRPSSIIAHRLAKNVGWRFTGNELLGRSVIKYDLEFGLCPGMVASWRLAGLHRRVYRVVFTRQEWKNGVDLLEEDLIHLLSCSERLLGDFPLSSPALTLPPHPFQVPWVPVHPNDTTLVLVHGHLKKLIGLGVVLATTAQVTADGECDALVLQDGGEFVTIFGKKQLQDAIRLGATFSLPSSMVVDGKQIPRVNKVERFRPLTHHCGPLVGFQGVVKLWGKIVVEAITDLREPMLTSEQAFVIRAPHMWPSAEAGEVWRSTVRNATTIKEFALALECLLDFAERAMNKGYFTPPPAVTTASTIVASTKPVGDDEEDDGQDITTLQEEMESAERAIREVYSTSSSTQQNAPPPPPPPPLLEQPVKPGRKKKDKAAPSIKVTLKRPTKGSEAASKIPEAAPAKMSEAAAIKTSEIAPEKASEVSVKMNETPTSEIASPTFKRLTESVARRSPRAKKMSEESPRQFQPSPSKRVKVVPTSIAPLPPITLTEEQTSSLPPPAVSLASESLVMSSFSAEAESNAHTVVLDQVGETGRQSFSTGPDQMPPSTVDATMEVNIEGQFAHNQSSDQAEGVSDAIPFSEAILSEAPIPSIEVGVSSESNPDSAVLSGVNENVAPSEALPMVETSPTADEPETAIESSIAVEKDQGNDVIDSTDVQVNDKGPDVEESIQILASERLDEIPSEPSSAAVVESTEIVSAGQLREVVPSIDDQALHENSAKAEEENTIPETQ